MSTEEKTTPVLKKDVVSRFITEFFLGTIDHK